MLVVMHNGNIECFDETPLYIKTLRRRDIFQINAAERWSNAEYRFNYLIRILCIENKWYRIHSRECLEKSALSLHNRERAQCPNIAKSQNRRAVGNNRNHTAFHRVLTSALWILSNKAGNCRNTGCVYERKIGHIPNGYCRHDTNLATELFVKRQRSFFQCVILTHRTTVSFMDGSRNTSHFLPKIVFKIAILTISP